MKARIDPLEAVHRLSCAIAQAVDLHDVYQIILNEVVEIMGVEKASIMVYDEARKGLRIAAARGMDPEVIKKVFVPAGEGISGRVFATETPVVVRDMKHAQLPSGQGQYKTSSLISAPVTSFEMNMGGRPLGVINVTDRRDGTPFTEGDLKLLTTASNQLASYMHILRLTDEVRAAERLMGELEVARAIQQRLLPVKPLALDGLDVYGRVVAAEKVGGDCYDYFFTHTRKPTFIVADVSGHNVPAAMLMASLRSVIRAQRDTDYAPAMLVQKVNTMLFDDLSSTEQFISMVYLQYLPARKLIRYTNAGHPPPLVWRASLNAFEELMTDDPLVGIDAFSLYHEKQMVVSSGDVMLLYTDGVTEAANAAGERMGTGVLKEVLREVAHLSAREIVDAVIGAATEFAGAPVLKDDVTVLVLKVV